VVSDATRDCVGAGYAAPLKPKASIDSEKWASSDNEDEDNSAPSITSTPRSAPSETAGTINLGMQVNRRLILGRQPQIRAAVRGFGTT